MVSNNMTLNNFFGSLKRGTSLCITLFDFGQPTGDITFYSIFNHYQYSSQIYDSLIFLTSGECFHIHQIKTVYKCTTFKDISPNHYSSGDLFNISYKFGSSTEPRLVKLIKELPFSSTKPSILVSLVNNTKKTEYRRFVIDGITNIQYISSNKFTDMSDTDEYSDTESSFDSCSETDSDEEMVMIPMSELEALKSSESLENELNRRIHDYKFALKKIQQEKSQLAKDNLILIDSERTLFTKCSNQNLIIKRLRTKTSQLMDDLRKLQSKYDMLTTAHNTHLQLHHEDNEDVQLEFAILKQDAIQLQKENEKLKHQSSKSTYKNMCVSAKIISSALLGCIQRQKLKQQQNSILTIQAALWSNLIRKDTQWAISHLNQNNEIESDDFDDYLSEWEIVK